MCAGRAPYILPHNDLMMDCIIMMCSNNVSQGSPVLEWQGPENLQNQNLPEGFCNEPKSQRLGF